MKRLKKAIYVLVFAAIYGTALPCAAQKMTTATTLQQQAPFTVKTVSFQEWYAGIKVGGTGINIFVPITNLSDNVEIDRIYFRNLTGKLNEKNGKYFAILENDSKNYTFKKPEAPADYPFRLKDDECVVSYVEGGTTKYLKITSVNEFAGTYYENGPPSIYEKKSSTIVATVDDDE
ncbi:hypothetical protein [Winogradskyella schleiferi]|uniref:hypothetical protein n=1 Tax=Winogradskyella schleiferi TaxID=2686078 RepID=UPI0015B7EEDF|nr:hypothetical protein [Winogradskyella schleiferi]